MIDSLNLLIGALAVFLVCLVPLARLRGSVDKLKREKAALEGDKRLLSSQLEMERKASRERENFLNASREDLNRHFQVLANRIFEEKSRTFSELNRERLTSLLQPFGQKMELIQRQAEKSYTRSVEDATRLKTQIEQLSLLNQRVGEEARNLTKALKGQSQTRGAWGEMILESVLERSGLRKGEQYETQKSFQDEDLRRLRPDALVHLPGERDIIIDAKVSLVAYERAVNAATSLEREEAAKAHVQSVRSHVRELEGKEYDRIPGINTIDLVLMFIPVEGAFSLAVQADDSLFAQAFEKRIIIVSPTTLFATLKTVETSWRYESQSRNARDIARKAGQMYDKLAGFVTDMERVDKALETARKATADAMGKLSTGRGNLIRRAEELRELGAAPTKTLPSRMTQDSEES